MNKFTRKDVEVACSRGASDEAFDATYHAALRATRAETNTRTYYAILVATYDATLRETRTATLDTTHTTVDDAIYWAAYARPSGTLG